MAVGESLLAKRMRFDERRRARAAALCGEEDSGEDEGRPGESQSREEAAGSKRPHLSSRTRVIPGTSHAGKGGNDDPFDEEEDEEDEDAVGSSRSRGVGSKAQARCVAMKLPASESTNERNRAAQPLAAAAMPGLSKAQRKKQRVRDRKAAEDRRVREEAEATRLQQLRMHAKAEAECKTRDDGSHGAGLL